MKDLIDLQQMQTRYLTLIDNMEDFYQNHTVELAEFYFDGVRVFEFSYGVMELPDAAGRARLLFHSPAATIIKFNINAGYETEKHTKQVSESYFYIRGYMNDLVSGDTYGPGSVKKYKPGDVIHCRIPEDMECIGIYTPGLERKEWN